MVSIWKYHLGFAIIDIKTLLLIVCYLDERVMGNIFWCCLKAKPLQCKSTHCFGHWIICFPDFLYTLSPISPSTNKQNIHQRKTMRSVWLRCTLPVDLGIKRSNVSGDELFPWSWHNFCTITYTCRLTIYIQCTFVFITYTF